MRATPQGVLDEARRLYCRTDTTVERIAATLGLNRTTIFRAASKNRWLKFQRTRSTRTIYRRAAGQKLGRKLRRYEHVHHIDGDMLNNDPSNLFVYDGPRSHTRAHGSLERCAFRLYREGHIRFNEQTGEYELP